MKKDSTQDTCFYIIGWCGIAIIVAYLIIKNLFHFNVLDYIFPCTLYTWTGFYCPGCGGTRALVALAKGQILKSFCLHPFVPYAVVVGGWFMVSQTVERLTKGKVGIALHFRMVYVWIALGLILTNFLWKNAMILLK